MSLILYQCGIRTADHQGGSSQGINGHGVASQNLNTTEASSDATAGPRKPTQLERGKELPYQS